MFRDLLDRFLGRSERSSTAPGPDAIVQVYARGERYFLEPSDRTRQEEAGYWIATGHVTELASHAVDEELGLAVLHELRRCRLEVEVPSRDAKLEAGLFRAMGVRSRKAAMAGTRACLVSREPVTGELRVEPLRNGGTKGDDRGYAGISEHAIGLPAGTAPREVGRAVRDALTHATVAA